MIGIGYVGSFKWKKVVSPEYNIEVVLLVDKRKKGSVKVKGFMNINNPLGSQ